MEILLAIFALSNTGLLVAVYYKLGRLEQKITGQQRRIKEIERELKSYA